VRRWLLIALAVFVVLHVFIWWRLVLPLASPWWQAGTASMIALAPSFPLVRRFGRRLHRDAARPWMLLGYLWFAVATYGLLGAIGAQIAVALGADARLAAIVAVASTVGVVVLGCLQVVARGPVVRRVRVPIAKLAREYTMVQLSDVHIGPLIGRGFAERLVRRVNALAPDLIVITGDLIDGPLYELARHVEPLRGLRARDGVYAVTGNHEWYWNAPEWIDHIRSLGIRVLRNEHVTIGDALQLAGVDDLSAGEDVPRAVAGRDPQLPLVLLAHQPRTVARAVEAGVDLQLSGHTHGGQMLPLGWLARFWDPVVSGLARFGKTWLYVSEGTGFWGPPVRVGTRCEIAAITLATR
jgi:uncharacterized protein